MSETENIEPAVDDAELTPRAAALAEEKAAADKPTDAELVAQRSADVAEDSSDEHVKVFVLPPGPKPTKANGFSHEANFAATRQYAISQGLRPTGDVRHVSTKPFGPGGKSWALTYAVPAVPAERFDFETVRVLTEHETGEDGHASTTPEGTGAPAQSDADAKASAEAKEAGNAKAAADADAGKPPTDANTREQIDTYAAGIGVDTTGAKTKAEALALIAAKPSA